MKNTAIVISSCDAYSDLWDPFFNLFAKYWNNNSFPVYLISNQKRIPIENVQIITAGQNNSWSDDMKSALNQIQEENIILILEDYLLTSPVNTTFLSECLTIFEDEKAGYFLITCFPEKFDFLYPVDNKNPKKIYGEILKDSSYLCSLQIAIWKKSYLMGILKTGENPWQFEKNGTERASSSKFKHLRLLSETGNKAVHGPITYYCTTVTKGKWMRGALELCKKENIKVDLSQRQVESRTEEFLRKIYNHSPLAVRKILNFIHHRLLNFLPN